MIWEVPISIRRYDGAVTPSGSAAVRQKGKSRRRIKTKRIIYYLNLFGP
jgi:hypothetical protein